MWGLIEPKAWARCVAVNRAEQESLRTISTIGRGITMTFQKMIDREAPYYLHSATLERAEEFELVVMEYKQAVEQLWPDLNHHQESEKYAAALSPLAGDRSHAGRQSRARLTLCHARPQHSADYRSC